MLNNTDKFHIFSELNSKNLIMKQKNLFYLVAVTIVFSLFFTACSQSSSNKASVADDTEMVLEKGEAAADESKCGEGKCGEGTEEADTSKKSGESKCGEAKCGEGEDEEEKCGEGKCGA